MSSIDGQNGFPRTLSFNTTAGTANIGELEDCTTYNINAAFRNKDELGISSEILSVSTSLIRKKMCFLILYVLMYCVELYNDNTWAEIHLQYLIFAYSFWQISLFSTPSLSLDR